MTSDEFALAGYAGSVNNTLFPLNNNERFKKVFKNKNLKILMNCPSWLYAAMVIIEKGTIRVDGVKNRPIEGIEKDKLKWNVYLEMDIVLYSLILSKRRTLKDIALELFKGNIKLKGFLYILDLIKLFNCLFKEKLRYDPPDEQEP